MSIIIYGAGTYGRYAYWEYVDKEEILFFVDRNKSIGEVQGLPLAVEGPEILEQYPGVPIVIAVCHNQGIRESLEKYGERKFIEYKPLPGINMQDYVVAKQMRMNNILLQELDKRAVNLGAFIGDEIFLPELSFIHGGSGVLDYAFIATILKRFHCRTYMEIGSYIGASLNVAAEYCEKCYSLTAAEDSPYHMHECCRNWNIPDFSNRLVYKDNIKQFSCIDSKTFDFSMLPGDVDCYFIDGDHSYEGVWQDTKNIFAHRKTDSIVIWHDLKYTGYVTALAIKQAIGKEFANVYAVDNNICAVYIPEKYKEMLPVHAWEYTEEKQPLYVYDTKLVVKVR